VFVSRSSGNHAKQIGRGGRPVWCSVYKPRTGLVCTISMIAAKMEIEGDVSWCCMDARTRPAPPKLCWEAALWVARLSRSGALESQAAQVAAANGPARTLAALVSWRPGSRWAARLYFVRSIFRTWTGDREPSVGPPRRSWAVLDNTRCGCGNPQQRGPVDAYSKPR
jgi:hypothetical protein